MPDNHYPTEEELQKLRDWDITARPLSEFLDFLKFIWEFADWGFVVSPTGRSLHLHTGGWSGNEDIIDILEKTMFWQLFWKSSQRGGHYRFEILNWYLGPR